jgi:hypothetical protein
MLQVKTPKMQDSEKILWFMNKNSRIPMLHENLNCNGLVAVMENYLNSTDLYSTTCELQTLVLGF